MTVQPFDPVSELEHTHEHLTRLVLEAGRLVQASLTAGSGEDLRLRVCLESLRDHLLQHFAVEEEGLFPFIRAHLPPKGDHVDRLALAHDAICGAIVRLAHGAETNRTGGDRSVLSNLYERFETAYARHSREEANLFAELAGALDADQRGQLAELLRGL